jgi:hypothetical protein
MAERRWCGGEGGGGGGKVPDGVVGAGGGNGEGAGLAHALIDELVDTPARSQVPLVDGRI